MGSFNDASQKALERFDETMRELALCALSARSSASWRRELTRFAVMRSDPHDGRRQADHLAGRVSGRPPGSTAWRRSSRRKYGVWLSKNPSFEDCYRAEPSNRRGAWKDEGAIQNVATALAAGGVLSVVESDARSCSAENALRLPANCCMRSSNSERGFGKRMSGASIGNSSTAASRHSRGMRSKRSLKRPSKPAWLAGVNMAKRSEAFAEAATHVQLGKPFDAGEFKAFNAAARRIAKALRRAGVPLAAPDRPQGRPGR